jgi:DNA invertase Pin-like site-specific DNA recombinase
MSRVKAYGYINFSETDKNSEEKQKDTIRQYADARDIEIVRFYQDKGITQEFFEKLALAELLLDLEGNDQGIRTLLVEKMDQLAQDLVVQSAITCDLRSQGIEVISVLEGTVWNICSRLS